jgi:PBSX family phage terminase large subunit
LTNSFYGSKKNALYLRKYATNIESSVIPQFLSQVQCLHLNFDIKKNSIENQHGKKLYFMGIESSQTTADSKLKSIPNLERVLIEEATEITEDEYTKLNLSIRDKDSFPKIILTFNPSVREHWIYKKFYEQRGVDYDFVGVKDGVLYIHTTFLDNIDNLDESFLREAETCKKYDPVKYARDFEGKWLDSDSKALLTKELLDLSISKDDLTNFDKVVVAIDPAVSVNSNSDNTGIAVCGKKDDMYYVIHVEEAKLTPLEWANRAKELYIKYDADFIIYEENQGRING